VKYKNPVIGLLLLNILPVMKKTTG